MVGTIREFYDNAVAIRRGEWQHFEPSLDALQLHDNWLLRIADHRGLKRSDPCFQDLLNGTGHLP